MPNTKFEILRATDAQIIRTLEQLWRDFGSSADAAYNVAVFDSGDAQAVNGTFAGLASDPILSALVDSGGVVLHRVSANFRGNPARTVSVTRQSATDQVQVDVGSPADGRQLASVLVAVRAAFRAFTPAPEIDRALGPELAEFYRRREEGLLRLEGAAQSLITETTTHRQELDVELTKAKTAVDERLERQRTELNAEYERRKNELDARAGELDAKMKVIDDRTNTHARRQLRSDLKADLKSGREAFSLSQKTNRKRWPVHVLFGLLIVATGTLLGRELFVAGAVPGLPALAELAITALSLIGSIAFYIRWNDAWARQHANEEFTMQRLALDVDRASWVVEVALEWKEDKGTQIPAELLNRLTANLFVDDGGMERVKHPVEDLASVLLGASSAVKLSANGAEVSWDGKRLKQLQKEAARSE